MPIADAEKVSYCGCSQNVLAALHTKEQVLTLTDTPRLNFLPKKTNGLLNQT